MPSPEPSSTTIATASPRRSRGDAGEHRGQPRGLVVGGDDDRERPRAARDDAVLRPQHLADRALRRLRAKEPRERRRDVEQAALALGARAARHARAPREERHAPLRLGVVAVPADAAPLPVVGGDDDGRALEVALVAAPAEERLQQPVGLLDAFEVLGVVAAAGVAGLVDGQRLQHEQRGVLGPQHLARAGCERLVDLLVGGDGGDGADAALAEGVHEVRDADEPPALAARGERVEDRLALRAEAGDEVAPHSVRARRRAREHRGERRDRARGVDRPHVLADETLGREAVEERRARLGEAVGAAAVDDDEDDAAARRRPARVAQPRRRLRLRRRPGEPPLVNEHGEHRRARRVGLGGGDGGQAAALGEPARQQHEDQQLRDLFEEVPAGRVGILDHELPEAQAVGPRRADAEVVVDRAPEHDREAEVERDDERDRGRVEGAEEDEAGGQQRPQRGAQAQREVVAPEEGEQRQQRRQRAEQPQRVAAVRREDRQAEQQQRGGGEDRRERLALVEHVPEPRGDDLEAPGGLRVVAASAHAAQQRGRSPGGERERPAGGEGVGELEAVGEHGERDRLAAGDALRLQGGGHARLVDADAAGGEVDGLEQDRERRDRRRRGKRQVDTERLRARPDDGGLEQPGGDGEGERAEDGARRQRAQRLARPLAEAAERAGEAAAGPRGAEQEQRARGGGEQQRGRGEGRRAGAAGRCRRQQRGGDAEQRREVEQARDDGGDGGGRGGDPGPRREHGTQRLACLDRQRVVGEQRGVQDREQPHGARGRSRAAEQQPPGGGAQRERRGVAAEEQREQVRPSRQLAEALAQQRAVGEAQDREDGERREREGGDPAQPPPGCGGRGPPQPSPLFRRRRFLHRGSRHRSPSRAVAPVRRPSTIARRTSQDRACSRWPAATPRALS